MIFQLFALSVFALINVYRQMKPEGSVLIQYKIFLTDKIKKRNKIIYDAQYNTQKVTFQNYEYNVRKLNFLIRFFIQLNKQFRKLLPQCKTTFINYCLQSIIQIFLFYLCSICKRKLQISRRTTLYASNTRRRVGTKLPVTILHYSE